MLHGTDFWVAVVTSTKMKVAKQTTSAIHRLPRMIDSSYWSFVSVLLIPAAHANLHTNYDLPRTRIGYRYCSSAALITPVQFLTTDIEKFISLVLVIMIIMLIMSGQVWHRTSAHIVMASVASCRLRAQWGKIMTCCSSNHETTKSLVFQTLPHITISSTAWHT